MMKILAALVLSTAVISTGFAQSSKTVLGKLGQTTATTTIYRAPKTSAKSFYHAKAFEYLVIQEFNENWFKVYMSNGQYGYVPKTKCAELPYNVTADNVQTPRNTGGGQVTSSRSQTPTLSSRSGAAGVANYALNYIGTPYVWGGDDLNNGIDCSGFVKGLFGKIGVNLPRTAAEQARVGQRITRLEDLQQGDRLYFWSSKRGKIGHTGIYLGNGYFVHASMGRGKVATDYLGKKYWLNMLVDARR
ncbi:MAG: C40 family peptidase [Armatimonadetes bacterium]|nr:C40 family peptidase [Armatimonadota bacterium]